MDKYKVVISKHNDISRIGYFTDVYIGEQKIRYGVTSYSYTLWGAKRVAKKIISKHKQNRPNFEIVKEYVV